MSEFSLFFAQNVPTETVEEIIVSKRFVGKDGKPIPWKIRSITEEENEQFRKASMRKIKKKGVYTQEIDPTEYLGKLVSSSVVYPDLKNAELLKSYGVLSPASLLRKMILPGEYATLLQQVQALNGFDQSDEEVIEEVKN